MSGGLIEVTRVIVGGRRHSLGVFPRGEINSCAGGRGLLGSANTRWDGEAGNQGKAMWGLGWAGACIMRGDWDVVRAGRAAGREGGEVVMAWRGSASDRPSEGGEAVSNVDMCREVAATDVDHRVTSVKGARGHSAVKVGCVPEVT